MRADRLLSLMLLLQAHGRLTAQNLAERLEVSERTIYRDVEALSFAGIPVYTQSGSSGGIFLDETYRVSLTGLSAAEIRALFAPSGAGPLKDLGLAQPAEATRLKLLAALPNSQQAEVEQLRQRIYIDPVGWFREGEATPALPLLQQAVWEDRVVRFTYYRRDGTPLERTMQAYALVAKANVWYLVARTRRGDTRTYRVARIQTVSLTGHRFERDPAFDLVAYWQNAAQAFEASFFEGQAPCRVTMRVHPEAVWVFASGALDQYELIEQPDPAGWRILRVEFPTLDGAQMSLLSLGDRVEVIEPGELRDRLWAVARGMVALYEQAGRRL